MKERIRNRRRDPRTVATALMLLAAATTLPALALDRAAYSMEVLIRGLPAAEYAARGTTYIQALEEEDYSVRLTNRTGERVAIALSVDGLNTIDAKRTTAAEASRWILDPYESITIDGWQTSNRVARRFYFTTEAGSYGAWLGATDDLGIISAAVFREKRRPAPPRRTWTHSRAETGAPPGAGPSSPAPTAGEAEMRRERSSDAAAKPQDADLSEDMAATGIGEELRHRVRRVRFESEPKPVVVMSLRYEYRDELVRLGVLPEPIARNVDPLTRRERARGFEDLEFAPDPFRPRH